MSGSIGRVDLDLGIDYRGFDRQLSGIAGTATNKVGGAFKKLAVIVGGVFAVKSMFDYTKSAIAAASQLESAMQGLKSIVEGQGMSFQSANGFIQEYIADGLVPLSDAVLAYKNLAARGYNDEQIKNTMERLKDAASFGRQASKSLGEAVSSATEGLKNENSMLVDNAGVTKNVAKMWEDYAKSIGKGTQQLTKAEKIQAEVSGIMEETKFQVGDAAKYSDTYAGKVAKLSKTFGDIKVNIGNAFMPILSHVIPVLQTLANHLSRVTALIAQFSKALFGASSINQQAKAISNQASSADALGKAVKKAGKAAKGSLSSFDQLNVITQATADSMDDAASSVGGAADTPALVPDAAALTPEVDLSKFQPFLDMLNNIKETAIGIGDYFATQFGPPIQTAIGHLMEPLQAWKSTLRTTFNEIGDLGAPFKAWLKDDLVPFMQKWIVYAGGIWAGLLESAEMVFTDIKDAVMPILEWFVTDGLPLLTDFSSKALDVFESLFNGAKHIFDTLWSEGVKPGLGVLSTVIVDTLGIIKGFWDTFGEDIVKGIQTNIDGVVEIFDSLWVGFLKPIWDNLIKGMSWLWEKHLKGLVEQVATFIGKLVTGAQEINNKFFLPLINFLVKTLGPTFANIFSFIGDVIMTIVGVVADVAKGIFKSLGGIIDFLVGAFTGDWKRAWGGIKDFFGGIFDGIVGIFKGAINLILDGLNFLIRQLNKVKFDIPDWVPGIGGKGFGISIPEVPKLAKGGFASAPTLAMVGDNRNAQVDPEVITPLSKLQDMLGASNQVVVEVLYMLLDAIERLDLSIEMDGEKLARMIRPLLGSENSRIGKSSVTIGGVPV